MFIDFSTVKTGCDEVQILTHAGDGTAFACVRIAGGQVKVFLDNAAECDALISMFTHAGDQLRAAEAIAEAARS